jgi:hypothetical protein
MTPEEQAAAAERKAQREKLQASRLADKEKKVKEELVPTSEKKVKEQSRSLSMSSSSSAMDTEMNTAPVMTGFSILSSMSSAPPPIAETSSTLSSNTASTKSPPLSPMALPPVEIPLPPLEEEWMTDEKHNHRKVCSTFPFFLCLFSIVSFLPLFCSTKLRTNGYAKQKDIHIFILPGFLETKCRADMVNMQLMTRLVLIFFSVVCPLRANSYFFVLRLRDL